MKINRLEINNIASIEHAEIDFSSAPLAGADVFLICGVTGAGKSTILDAISLALYDQTPRLSTAQSDGRYLDVDGTPTTLRSTATLIKRGAGFASVTLDFTGSDGVDYRAEWSLRRARNKVTGKVQKREWTLTRLVDGQPDFVYDKKDVAAQIVAAVGLTFDEFCRTTMLAQGQFAQFLNSKADDKSDILAKVLDCPQYTRIGKSIYRHYAQARHDYEVKLAATENVTLLTDEQTAQIHEQLNELANSNKILEADRKAKNDVNAAVSRVAGCQDDMSRIVRQTEGYRSDFNDLCAHYAHQQQSLAKAKDDAYAKWQAMVRNDGRKKAADLQSQIDSLSKGEAYLALKENRAEHKRQSDRKLAVLSLGKQMETLDVRRNEAAEVKKDIDNRKTELEHLEREAVRTRAVADQSRVAKDDAAALMDKISRTASQFAVQMRATLTVGDECPVCMRTIDSPLPAENTVRQMVAQVRATTDKATRAWQEAETEASKAKGLLDSQNDQIAKLTKRHDKLTADVTAMSAKLAKGFEQLDIPADLAAGDLTQVVAAIDKTLDSVQQRITAGEETAGKIETLSRQAQTAMAQYLEQKSQLQALDNDVERLQMDVERTKTVVDWVLGANPDWNAGDCRPRVMPQQRVDMLLNQLTGNLTAAEANMKRLADEMAENQKVVNAYQHAHPDEDMARLADTVKALTTAIDDNNRQTGALTAQLENDSRMRDKHRQALVELEGLRKTSERWSALNAILGDAEGKTFSRVALSYVLGNLLDKANVYLRSLMPRYRLTARPGTLTIMLQDSYQGYQERPVNNTSGGETFIISLALALGLSHIGRGLSVDTLFIDEGFGNLSGEPLERAIETLRGLRGTHGRRVGLISHVAELRDRIPVKIVVDRPQTSPTATVTVTAD